MMKSTLLAGSLAIAGMVSAPAVAADAPRDAKIFAAAAAMQPKVVSWRRDIHQHPELSNQEIRTSALVAAHLKKLGFEVRTGVAKTGVIGILRGGKPGGVVALRADMDGLPVAEAPGLPFASTATATWRGQTVPVMHACGHDAHVAMLMGAAEILASMRADIKGTVVVLFQPAEEGPPTGETGGAPEIVRLKALDDPKPDAIFGLHVMPGQVGKLMWRSGGFMAGSDTWELDVQGKQTHGSSPWTGIDAASVAADIVTSFNQIGARQVNVAHAPTVLTVGQIQLGTRHNIIAGSFAMTGTLRTFDPAMRADIMDRMRNSMTSVEQRFGVKTDMRFVASNPVTANSPELVARMTPTLERAAKGAVDGSVDYVMGSEDFSAYQAVAPTFFFHLGIGDSASNHSPLFRIDEAAMETGVRAYALAALDFLDETGR